MKKVFENIVALIIEIIGLIGGAIWAYHTRWDYEPLILTIVSAIGICSFIVLRLLPQDSDRPIIELEFVRQGGMRSSPGILQDVSPKDESGMHYTMIVGGIYVFTIKRNYQLVIRNNSVNNAYKIVLYKKEENYLLEFENKVNSMVPLTINQPISIQLKYEISRPMTHHEAEELMNLPLPEEPENFTLIVAYQSESRNQFYSKFIPLKSNEQLKNKPNLDGYIMV